MRSFQPSFAAARSTTTSLLVAALALVPLHAGEIVPQPLPDPRIAGFNFPESEATLTRWITELTRSEPKTAATAFENIQRHGWGLWTALTLETNQTYEGQRLRVFETWMTPDDLAVLPPRRDNAVVEPAVPRLSPRRVSQLKIKSSDGEFGFGLLDSSTAVERVMGNVKFDPTAAGHIVRQQLLRKETLDTLLEGGAVQIPPFPATAIVIKPVFQFIRAQELVQGRYYALKAWQGPPSTIRPWPPGHWPGSVWIDVLGGGNGRGAIDEFGLADGSTRTDETTYPLSRLLSYRLSADDAVDLNRDKPAPIASAGDIAILVAMHVTGREIARWTWQTFWWTPSPDNPPAPSSPAIAGLRPDQLRGAARNYAMSLAYTMMSPDQPYVGGGNTTPVVYAYNPWLEARLAPADLPDSIPGLGPDGLPATNNHGIQSNCMSCHAQANYNPNQRTTAPRLTAARYVDLGAAEFVGTLQVDFLWSIARHSR